MNLRAIIIVAIAAAFAVNAHAQKASADYTVDATATIIAIDKTTRDITLKGPKGNWVVITAGPEIKNFDQLNVGDKVHARYNEALVLELKKGNDLAVTRTDEKSAVELVSVGLSPRNRSIPAGELAAYTAVANMILNMDEVVTKE